MFYIKLKSLEVRTRLIKHLKDNDILSVFHYVPLHSSTFGLKCSKFCGNDVYTTSESNKLLRLPIFYNISLQDVDRVVNSIINFKNFDV